jgi:hypothetical protein
MNPTYTNAKTAKENLEKATGLGCAGKSFNNDG